MTKERSIINEVLFVSVWVNNTKYYVNNSWQIVDIEAEHLKYDLWYNNCSNNKSHSSWIYLIEGDKYVRRKVYLVENEDVGEKCLIYNGVNKNDWGYILKKD